MRAIRIPLLAVLAAATVAGCMVARGPLFVADGAPPGGERGVDPLPVEIFARGQADDRPAGPDTLHVSLAVCFDPPTPGAGCDTAVDLGDTTARFADLSLVFEEILCRTAGGDTLRLLRQRRESRSSCDPSRTRACKSAPPVLLVVPRAVDAIDIDLVLAWRRRADGSLVRRSGHARRYRRVDERRLVPASR